MASFISDAAEISGDDGHSDEEAALRELEEAELAEGNGFVASEDDDEGGVGSGGFAVYAAVNRQQDEAHHRDVQASIARYTSRKRVRSDLEEDEQDDYNSDAQHSDASNKRRRKKRASGGKDAMYSHSDEEDTDGEAAHVARVRAFEQKEHLAAANFQRDLMLARRNNPASSSRAAAAVQSGSGSEEDSEEKEAEEIANNSNFFLSQGLAQSQPELRALAANNNSDQDGQAADDERGKAVRALGVINPNNIDTGGYFNREFQPYDNSLLAPGDDMGLTAQEVADVCSELYEQWGGDAIGDYSQLQTYQLALKMYPYDNAMHLYTLMQTYIAQLSRVVVALTARDLLFLGKDHPVENEVHMWRVRQVSTRITRLYESVSSTLMSTNGAKTSVKTYAVGFGYGLVEDLRSSLRLSSSATGHRLAFTTAARLGLRRHNSQLFKPVYTNYNGKYVFTRSYELMGDIVDVLAAMPNLSLVSTNYEHVTHNLHSIASAFEHADNTHLPKLVTSPEYMSFRNGQYHLPSDTLIPYDDIAANTSAVSFITFPHTDIEIFDKERDDADFKRGRWFNIYNSGRCATLKSILDYQYPGLPLPPDATYNGYQDPELCIRTVLAMMGRLFFGLGELDEFQKYVAFIGHSGVGKTKLLEFLMSYFGPYVFNLKNNPEEQFGWETAIGKRVCCVEEISRKSKIDSSQWLSMCCGSAQLAISRKGREQKDITWNMPIVVAGNSFPENWPNDKGQHGRRIFLAFFDRPLKANTVDTKIGDRLHAERGAIVVLLVRAYHSLVRELNGKDVDSIIHPDMKRDAAEVIGGNNLVTEFVHSSTVSFDKHGINSEKHIPLEVLMREYDCFVSEKSGSKGFGRNTRTKMDKEMFVSLLNSTGAQVVIFEEKDRNTGPANVFNHPRYVKRWPPLSTVEYQLGNKVISHESKQAFVFVAGVQLRLDECPRIRPKGEAAANASNAYNAQLGPANDTEEYLDSLSKHMNNTPAQLTGEEKAIYTEWNLFRKGSLSFSAAQANSARPAQSQRMAEGAKLATVPHGNELPTVSLQASPEERKYQRQLVQMSDNTLTRWESTVMCRYWQMLRLVGGENWPDDCAVMPRNGVSEGELRRYLQHDLRTVKLRLEARRLCDTNAYEQVLQAWGLASRYMNSM